MHTEVVVTPEGEIIGRLWNVVSTIASTLRPVAMVATPVMIATLLKTGMRLPGAIPGPSALLLPIGGLLPGALRLLLLPGLLSLAGRRAAAIDGPAELAGRRAAAIDGPAELAGRRAAAIAGPAEPGWAARCCD